MRNLGLLALTCLLALAIMPQVDAGFRVRPVSDRSENGEHNGRNGDRDDRFHRENHNENDNDDGDDDQMNNDDRNHNGNRGHDDNNRGHDDNQQNGDGHGDKGHGNNDGNHGHDGNHGNHDQNDTDNQGDHDAHRKPLLEMIHLFIRKFDRNRDRVLSYREAPKWLKKNFSQVDSNRDGKIDAKELMQLVDRHKQNEGDKERPPRHPRPIDNRPPPQY